MENIIRAIKNKYPVSDDSINALTSQFDKHVFPVKANVVSANGPNKRVFFIEHGLTRSYIITKEKEVTTWFCQEGDLFYSSLEFYKNEAGFEYVQTLEETVAYSISNIKLHELCRTNIEIANWIRVFNEDIFLHLQNIRIERLTLSATERYLQFNKQFPTLCQRVNLGYLASYLGITLPTLSRIRAKY